MRDGREGVNQDARYFARFRAAFNTWGRVDTDAAGRVFHCVQRKKLAGGVPGAKAPSIHALRSPRNKTAVSSEVASDVSSTFADNVLP